MAGPVAPSLPPAEIGLFQNELETLRTPAHDVGPFLRGEPESWKVRTFDERAIVSALSRRARIDALLVGFNALHQSGETTRAAFELPRPPGNLLILHQLDDACFDFLTGDFGLEQRGLTGDQLRPLRIPAERNPEDEPLLNWPQGLPVGDEREVLRCRTLRSFMPAEDSVWRVVLEAYEGGERFPVLLRTARVVPERLVVCSLLIEWRDPVHAALLRNMLTYCARGTPEVAVLEPSGGQPDGYRPQVLASRLRMRRAGAVVVPVESEASIPLDTWPLRTVRHIVAPDAIAADTVLGEVRKPRDWARAGGVLTRVGADGELTLHARAKDARWVAEHWATWYAGVPVASWEGKLASCRAVLRMLEAVHAQSDLGRLGLERPHEHSATVLAPQLERRIADGDGSCEETISATANAWDIDALMGQRVFSKSTRDKVETWLRNAFVHAPGADGRQDPAPPIEDQLDIARALRDPELLAAAWERMGDQTVTALSVTRLREALVACRAWDRFKTLPPAVADALDDETVAAELRDRVLVSAEFLAAVADLNHHAPDHPAANLDGEAVAVAVETLSARGDIGRLGTPQAPDATPVEVATEALALLRHMVAQPTTTWQIHPPSEGLPAQAVQEVLREARHSRELVRRDDEIRRTLVRAIWLLGAANLAVMAIVLGRVMRWSKLSFPDGVFIGAGLGAGVVALWIVRWHRGRRGHPAPALAGDVMGAVAVAVAGCVGVLMSRLQLAGADWLDLPLALLAAGGALLTLLLALGRWDLAPTWGGTVREIVTEQVPLLRSRSKRDEGEPPA